MENATKALLIAAAILIAIVLVSIGVFVLRQGQDAMGTINMNETEVLAFNSRLTTYEGTIRGSNLKSLKQRVDLVNKDLELKGAKAIKITELEAVLNSSDFSTAKYYTVDMSSEGLRDNMGLIQEIKVKSASN